MTRQAPLSAQLAALVGGLAVSACHSHSPTSSALEACDHIFDVLYVQCAQVAPPDSEIARWRQRYEPLCQRGLALPGIAVTPELLSSCADQVAADGCRVPDALSACLKPGTLGADASCSDSLQCQSNSCSKPFLFDPDSGTSEMLTCGSCNPGIPLGQPCGRSVQGQCAPGTHCGGSPFNSTCIAAIGGEIGATCAPGQSPSSCKTGLYCDPSQATCAAPASAGAPCFETAACTYPLICSTQPDGGLGGTTCQSPGQAGAPCRQDSDCTKSLVCDSASARCALLTWAGSDQPCSNTTRCLVGNCPTASASARCPVILGDGQPCNPRNPSTETCDAFASCIGGVCALVQSATCP